MDAIDWRRDDGNDVALRRRHAGPVRQPFFPAVDYADVAPGVVEHLARLPDAPEGHISPVQAEFLYSLVRLVRPQLIVETGLCVGHSATIAMLAQESLGLPGRLVSVDIGHYPQSARAAQILRDRFAGFRYVEGDSRTELSAAVHGELRAEEGLSLGLALIDGGHDAETVAHDLDTLHAFLAVGGFLWLDDFEKEVPNYGVNRAGWAFARRWGNCQRFRAPGNRGIMLYQKLG
jgi:predicted O-methyltransferase YrrM